MQMSSSSASEIRMIEEHGASSPISKISHDIDSCVRSHSSLLEVDQVSIMSGLLRPPRTK
jgi:hypothetical protein